MAKSEDFSHLLSRRWYKQSFNATPAGIHCAGTSLIGPMKKNLGYTYRAMIFDYAHDFLEAYYDKDDFHTLAHQFMKRYNENQDYLQQLIDASIEKKHLVDDYIKSVSGKMDVLSKEELIKSYKKFSDLLAFMIAESHMIEGYALTKDSQLKGLLRAELEEQGKGKEFNKIFTLLTQPIRKVFITEYNNTISAIITEIKKDKIMLGKFNEQPVKDIVSEIEKNEKLIQLFEVLERDFYWLKNSYKNAYRLGRKFFIKEVKRTLKEDNIKSIQDEVFEENKKRKTILIKNLGLGNEVQEIAEITEVMAYWQDDRKKYILQCSTIIEEFLIAIGKKFNLNAHNLRYILPEEMSVEKLEQIHDDFFKERIGGSIVIYEGEKFSIFTGEEYKKFKNSLSKHEKLADMIEITGIIASMGDISGHVKICKTIKEIEEFKEGEVLVTGMTRPEFVPAMKKAAAIVTDEGGITSHAAVISRELKKPCIIGTKIATKVLKNGDFVEVKANHGVVKKINSTDVMRSEANHHRIKKK